MKSCAWNYLRTCWVISTPEQLRLFSYIPSRTQSETRSDIPYVLDSHTRPLDRTCNLVPCRALYHHVLYNTNNFFKGNPWGVCQIARKKFRADHGGNEPNWWETKRETRQSTYIQLNGFQLPFAETRALQASRLILCRLGLHHEPKCLFGNRNRGQVSFDFPE